MGGTTGRFVGRDTELARVGEAFGRARSGSPSALLIEGDAGIGKSRLMAEATAAFREPEDVIAVGHGIELSGGELAYGVVADSLRSLVRDVGAAVVREAAGPYVPDLASLCPPLDPRPAVTERGRLFPGYVSTLEHLGADRLVVLLIEDLQWADASSRDLLGYLVRVAGQCQLLMAMTFRTHDPAVDPGASELVSSLESLAQTASLTVPALSDLDVAALISDLTDEVASVGLVQRTMSLTQGNPLFTEQLVAAGLSQDGPTPDAVLEPMLQRIRRLDPDTRRLVQLASLTDGSLPHHLLEQVFCNPSGREESERFADATGRALDGGILRFDATERRYSFSHAMLRQAADRSIRPADRLAGHRRWAELLSLKENHAGEPEMQIAAAHHWARADDSTRAFDSALAAAEHARNLGVSEEVASLLRRSLDLWDHVPEPETRSGQSREQVLHATLRHLRSVGRTSVCLDLMDAELRREGHTDVTELRWLCLRLARALYIGELAEPDPPLYAEGVRSAEALLAAEPSPLHFDAVWQLSRHVWFSDPDLSLRLQEFLAGVPPMGPYEPPVPSGAFVWLHMVERGRFAESIVLLQGALSKARDERTLLDIESHLGVTLHRAGRFAESVRWLERAHARLTDPHLLPAAWAYCHVDLAEAVWPTGDWTRVLALVAEARRAEIDEIFYLIWTACIAGDVECRRGNLTEAARWARETRDLIGENQDGAFSRFLTPTRYVESAVAAAQGDLVGARERLGRIMTAPGIEANGYLWESVILAASVEGDIGTPEQAEAVSARAAIRAAAERLPRTGDYYPVAYDQVMADLQRATGRDTIEHWRGVVDGWCGIGHVTYLGGALLHTAGCALRAGDRDTATDALTEAWAVAGELGAVPLRDAVIDLALRSHIELKEAAVGDRSTPSAGALGRLTERELEVLRHLAQGASNDELAEILFISPKTVSVHVSHILTKLGVTSRAKATAIAYDEGLLGGPGG
jgi:DNA-binding CsgD family transcriptional regulator/tetratricopeptide (TPR) repeat protein